MVKRAIEFMYAGVAEVMADDLSEERFGIFRGRVHQQDTQIGIFQQAPDRVRLRKDGGLVGIARLKP